MLVDSCGKCCLSSTKISLKGWLRGPEVTPPVCSVFNGLRITDLRIPSKSKSSLEVHPMFLGSLGWVLSLSGNVLFIQREGGREPGQH